MEARTFSVLRRRVGVVKGVRNSGVDQVRAGVPRRRTLAGSADGRAAGLAAQGTPQAAR